MLSVVPIQRNTVKTDCFNPAPSLPYELRVGDFQLAMQDVYDFFTTSMQFYRRRGYTASKTYCGRKPVPASFPTC